MKKYEVITVKGNQVSSVRLDRKQEAENLYKAAKYDPNYSFVKLNLIFLQNRNWVVRRLHLSKNGVEIQ